MNKNKRHPFRAVAWILVLGLFLVNFGGASVLAPTVGVMPAPLRYNDQMTGMVRELQRLGILEHTSQEVVEEMIHYQLKTGHSLAKILNNPLWAKRLGMAPLKFQATWYMANPFEVLPVDLQLAIRKCNVTISTRSQLMKWVDQTNPVRAAEWKKALEKALIETTVANLFRGSRGQKPYARNGEFLKPIAVEVSKGKFEIYDGHIATDPALIPTGSTVLLLVKIQGKERVLKVKATDIGSGIRGRHVDLPIHLNPKLAAPLPHTKFPRRYISNPTVKILRPAKAINPNQKV